MDNNSHSATETLPDFPNFKIEQVTLPNGEVVDAAVFTFNNKTTPKDLSDSLEYFIKNPYAQGVKYYIADFVELPGISKILLEAQKIAAKVDSLLNGSKPSWETIIITESSMLNLMAEAFKRIIVWQYPTAMDGLHIVTNLDEAKEIILSKESLEV